MHNPYIMAGSMAGRNDRPVQEAGCVNSRFVFDILSKITLLYFQFSIRSYLPREFFNHLKRIPRRF